MRLYTEGYTLHVQQEQEGERSSQGFFQVPAEEGERRAARLWGRAWIDMYEAASQAGGGRVQGQARRRRQTPVLEERNAREDGMDGFAIDREFGRESGSGGYARDEAAEMAWNGAAAVWRACTYT